MMKGFILRDKSLMNYLDKTNSCALIKFKTQYKVYFLLNCL